MVDRSYRPSPLQHVELVTEDGSWALVFRRRLAQPPQQVWAALTEPDQLAQWAPFTADRPLHSTGPVTLLATDQPGPRQIAATVLAARPPHLVEYTWGDDVLRWELAADGAGTALRLTHVRAGREQAGMLAAGWHICLDVAAELVAGSPIGRIVGADALDHGWTELNRRYSARLGVDVVSPPGQAAAAAGD
jgi:uncharacterized protein YndB with AHSA1/START domain